MDHSLIADVEEMKVGQCVEKMDSSEGDEVCSAVRVSYVSDGVEPRMGEDEVGERVKVEAEHAEELQSEEGLVLVIISSSQTSSSSARNQCRTSSKRAILAPPAAAWLRLSGSVT